ncbi:hypothetical protein LOD99_10720 [Oopsacas minuta]|uniref:Uncharacterized protein n=1 Tax=Oopsacas minuta TaxID=111878 RepID=A0AAV7KEP5_9METZ|nr:hypothetical protein LOD99_10720 [Oopsacas minuta]
MRNSTMTLVQVVGFLQNQQNIERVHTLLDEDRRITLRELEERVGISKTKRHMIITEDLECRRYNTEEDFLDRIVTEDATWFHYYGPESNIQSEQWKRRDEPVPIRVKAQNQQGREWQQYYGIWKEKHLDWLLRRPP